MVVKKRLFGQSEMSYFEYLRRYIQEAGTCRIRFDKFASMLTLLTEGEFLLSELSSQRKRSTPAYRKLYRRQARLRITLLIPETLDRGFWTEAPEETVEDIEPEPPKKRKGKSLNYEDDELTTA